MQPAAWNLSCPDWEKRLREGRPLVPDLPLTDQGRVAATIFDKLRLHDVAGHPCMADAGGEWFRAIVRALFGSYDRLARRRMITELLLLVPKKNSKTSSGALIMLVALLLNERPNGLAIMTAPVIKTAEIAFEAAAGAIELDPVLRKKLHVRSHLKTIVHRESKAELKIMTFDPESLTGQKCSIGVLIDELHVVAKMAKAASAIRQIRGGMLPFPEAFLAFITTQSEEAPAGAFKAELQRARAIRDGERNGTMLPVLYEFPAKMQKDREMPWRNPATWRMVTPNAGRSIDIERLLESCVEAEQTGEAEFRAWASQHLNIEIGLVLGSDAWAGAEYWEQQGIDTGLTLEELIERSEVVTIGIDGGGLDDLLGFAAMGRDKITRDWLLWTHAWAHPSVLKRRKSEAPRLQDFAADGNLTLVKRIGEDMAELAARTLQIYDSGLLDRIGVDSAGVGGIIDAIVGVGIPQEKIDSQGKMSPVIVGISQGWRLGGAIKTLERRLAEGGLWHGAQALMAWCVGNAKVEPRANSILITKQASGTAKIDPLMATLNAASLMMLNPQASGKSEPQMLFF